MSQIDLKNELIGKYLKIIAVVALYWYLYKTRIDGYDTLVYYSQISFTRLTSIITVFVNKALLSSDSVKLDAPLFITWIQCIVSVLVCLSLKLIKRSYLPNPNVFSKNTIQKVSETTMSSCEFSSSNEIKQSTVFFLFFRFCHWRYCSH